jgi:group I intron endonuclease
MQKLSKLKKMGVYKIISPTGRVYVGSSIDIRHRWWYYNRSLAKNQPILNRSFLKHGIDNHKFEIIEECSYSDLFKLERKHGILLNALCDLGGLNIKLPKAGEERAIYSNELRKKLSDLAKNRTYSKETRLKFSLSKKGKPSKNGMSKIVINLETGIYYDSIRSAAYAYNIPRQTLTNKLRLKANYVRNNTSLCLV